MPIELTQHGRYLSSLDSATFTQEGQARGPAPTSPPLIMARLPLPPSGEKEQGRAGMLSQLDRHFKEYGGFDNLSPGEKEQVKNARLRFDEMKDLLSLANYNVIHEKELLKDKFYNGGRSNTKSDTFVDYLLSYFFTCIFFGLMYILFCK